MSGISDDDFIPLQPYEPPDDDDTAPAKESAGDVDLDKLPRCRECGYILYGMTTGRCPECGTQQSVALPPLTTAEVQAELARQAKIERIMRYAGSGMLVLGLLLTAYGSRALWHFAVCMLSPVAAVSFVVLGRQLVLGDDMHWSLAIIGSVWLVIGIGMALTFG